MAAFDFPVAPTIGQGYQGYTWDGEKWLITYAVPNTAGIIAVKVFTNNGTYTPSPSMTSCMIEVQAGGGGGGGAAVGGANVQNAGGGGGGGGYAKKFATAAMIGLSQPVTVGIAGLGGAAGNNNGVAGGSSSVGTLCSAAGGNGGNGSPANGNGTWVAGGNWTAGDFGITGGQGSQGFPNNFVSAFPPTGGAGGGSHFGDGAMPITCGQPGTWGTGYGAGGGGASSWNGGASQAGGRATQGIVIITEYGMTALDAANAGNAVRYDVVQSLSASQHAQGRSNVYAAPFDAMAYNGMNINGSALIDQPKFGNVTPAVNQQLQTVECWAIECGGAGRMLGSNGLDAQEIGGAYHRIYCTQAFTSGASDYAYMSHRVEGNRIARLMWGTAQAQPLTIGFWVKAYGGTMTVSVHNHDTSRQYLTTVACGPALWEWKTITIPGCQDGVWNSGNAISMQIIFCAVGNSTAAPNVWGSNGGAIAAPGQSNMLPGLGWQLAISGVIALPGVDAPTAERSLLIKRPFDQELLLCKRYWQKSYPYANVAGTNTLAGGQGIYITGLAGSINAGALVHFGVPMRTAPSVVTYAIQTGTPGAATNNYNGGDVPTTLDLIGEHGFRWYLIGNPSDYAINSTMQYVADARV